MSTDRADALRRRLARQSLVVPLRQGDGNPAVGIPGAPGATFAPLARAMPGRPWYAVDHRDVPVAEIADLVAEAARGRPVHLVGHASGGRVAHYLVSALRDRGRQVASLTLLDALADEAGPDVPAPAAISCRTLLVTATNPPTATAERAWNWLPLLRNGMEKREIAASRDGMVSDPDLAALLTTFFADVETPARKAS